MDLKSSKYLPPSHGGVGVRKENPFEDTFPDPLCKLNLKETSDLVNLFPMAKKDGAPCTPGRPVFSFNAGSRKNIPSKWDDAEKWLIGHDSPVHHLHGFVKSPDSVFKQSGNGGTNGFMIRQQETEVSSQKLGVTEEKVSKAISVFQVPTTVSLAQDHRHHHHNLTKPFNGVAASDSSDVLLKDKFTNDVEPSFSRFKCVVKHLQQTSMKDASTEVVQEVKHRDIGTDMAPPGGSTALRCPTPFKSLSPPRHNTPASMSGPLTLMDPSSSFDIGELQECHFAKLQLQTQFDPVTSNWSSREEEEEDVSKSLRHFEMNNECQKSIPEPRPCAWEEEETTKSLLRYQREEAKIQAWVNLQNAKAEAQSRKLEVKIQKMKSKFEEKMMKRMASVHRKAEELRAAAKHEHNQHIKNATMQAKKTKNVHESMHFSCGCFPCNTLHS